MGSIETVDVRTTTRTEWIDITQLVRNAIRKSGVTEGLACVFCAHSTAAITLQEHADPAVKNALFDRLSALVPRDAPADEARADNYDAHIKSSLLGASVTLIVAEGRPVLGSWQALYFCEFDGPRSRHLSIRVVPA
jgi:secondary thiamine-phosphate synthase enzyme